VAERRWLMRINVLKSYSPLGITSLMGAMWRYVGIKRAEPKDSAPLASRTFGGPLRYSLLYRAPALSTTEDGRFWIWSRTMVSGSSKPVQALPGFEEGVGVLYA
jgi:hypothetical protein